jgi:hypothetical protein
VIGFDAFIKTGRRSELDLDLNNNTSFTVAAPTPIDRPTKCTNVKKDGNDII